MNKGEVNIVGRTDDPNFRFLAHAIAKTFDRENLLFDLFKACEGSSERMNQVVAVARSSWEAEGKSDPELAAVFLKAQLPSLRDDRTTPEKPLP